MSTLSLKYRLKVPTPGKQLTFREGVGVFVSSIFKKHFLLIDHGRLPVFMSRFQGFDEYAITWCEEWRNFFFQMSKQATLLWKDPKMRGWQYKTAYSWQLVYLPSKRTMRYQCVWGTFSYCKLRELKDLGRMYKRELISEFLKVNSSIHLFYRYVLFLNTYHIIFSRDHIFHTTAKQVISCRG